MNKNFLKQWILINILLNLLIVLKINIYGQNIKKNVMILTCKKNIFKKIKMKIKLIF